MCRIFLSNHFEFFSLKKLKQTFKNLEEEAGGHGIGVGFYIGNQPVIEKGRHVTPDIAAEIVHDIKRPAMVHFRAASPGVKVMDWLNHPFRTNEGLFCHNGTIPDLVNAGTASDSYLVKKLIDHIGFAVVAGILHDYGVFALLKPDGTFEVYKNGVEGIENTKGTARPFEEIITSHHGEPWYIGISNKKTLSAKFEIPDEKESISYNSEAFAVCGVNSKQYTRIMEESGSFIPKGMVALLAVNSDVVNRFNLFPVIKEKLVRKVTPCAASSE